MTGRRLVKTLVTGFALARMPGCQDANNLDHYAKQLAVKCTHIIGSLDLLDKAGKNNAKDLSKDFSNPFLVSTTIAKNSVEEDAGGEGKMSGQEACQEAKE